MCGTVYLTLCKVLFVFLMTESSSCNLENQTQTALESQYEAEGYTFLPSYHKQSSLNPSTPEELFQ